MLVIHKKYSAFLLEWNLEVEVNWERPYLLRSIKLNPSITFHFYSLPCTGTFGLLPITYYVIVKCHEATYIGINPMNSIHFNHQ